jgi:hypothetical protein
MTYPWPVHPAADLFRLLNDEELAALADDIDANGLIEPIWLYDDPDRGAVLLDGRNRVRACALAEYEITDDDIRWYTGGDPIGFVISENLRRRHLSIGETAAALDEAAELYRKEARKRQARAVAERNRREAEDRRRAYEAAINEEESEGDEKNVDQPECADRHTLADQQEEVEEEEGADEDRRPIRSADQLAAVGGISGRSMARYQRLKRDAPDLAAQVRSGELALDAAEKELRHRIRVAEQRERDLVEQRARALPGAATIEEAECLDWLPTAPDVDLLLTDPPYSTDVDDVDTFAHEWLPAALAKVKPTGRAYVCIGSYPDELLAYLSAPRAGMILADVLVWTYRNTIGPSSSVDYSRNWQAILHFRGPDAPPLRTDSLTEKFAVIDMNAPDGRRGERWHTWQKPDELGEMLVRHATEPAAVVLDPFAGTGTFLLAAARLGRIAHGADVDPEMIAIAKERGCE